MLNILKLIQKMYPKQSSIHQLNNETYNFQDHWLHILVIHMRNVILIEIHFWISFGMSSITTFEHDIKQRIRTYCNLRHLLFLDHSNLLLGQILFHQICHISTLFFLRNYIFFTFFNSEQAAHKIHYQLPKFLVLRSWSLVDPILCFGQLIGI